MSVAHLKVFGGILFLMSHVASILINKFDESTLLARAGSGDAHEEVRILPDSWYWPLVHPRSVPRCAGALGGRAAPTAHRASRNFGNVTVRSRNFCMLEVLSVHLLSVLSVCPAARSRPSSHNSQATLNSQSTLDSQSADTDPRRRRRPPRSRFRSSRPPPP